MYKQIIHCVRLRHKMKDINKHILEDVVYWFKFRNETKTHRSHTRVKSRGIRSSDGHNTGIFSWPQYRILQLATIQDSSVGHNTVFFSWPQYRIFPQYKILQLATIQDSSAGHNIGFFSWPQYKILQLATIHNITLK